MDLDELAKNASKALKEITSNYQWENEIWISIDVISNVIVHLSIYEVSYQTLIKYFTQ